MGGNKLTRAGMRVLDQVGEDEIADLVLAGSSIRDLCNMFGVGQRAYYKWLDDEPGRRELIERARQARAEVLDAEGLEIVDSVPADRDEIARAKLRAEQRRFVAKQLDARRRSGGGGVQLNISASQLHLEAVREVGGAPEARGGGQEAREAEYEVVDPEEELRALLGPVEDAREGSEG